VMKISIVISTCKYRVRLVENLICRFHLDVNECLSNSTCDADATCNNTEGSYTCTCDSGYSGDGFSCDGMHRTEIVMIIKFRRARNQM
jgi:hypothetical protein